MGFLLTGTSRWGLGASAAAPAVWLILQGGEHLWDGILLLALAAFIVLRPDDWLIRRIIKWRNRSGIRMSHVHEWSFDSEQIELTTSTSYDPQVVYQRKCQARWQDIKECVRSPDGFYLFFRLVSGFVWKGFGDQWLPARAFADPESLAAFAEMAQTKVKRYRTAQ
jgi:hypothetical protein